MINDIIVPDKYSDSEIKSYLDSLTLCERQYSIGLYNSGITIYKQQVRALNLFYAMYRNGIFKENSSLCVVGGGAAGLTFAASAIKLGLKVVILEKESLFMHMQYGCDIRHVHPHMYDWPEKGSLFPYAKLPVLSWTAGSATNVTKQIVNSFLSIYKPSQNAKAYFNVKEIEVSYDNSIGKLQIDSFGRPLDGDEEKPIQASVHNIVYCTGYGIESATQNGSGTPSYWRNDDLSQTIVDQRNKFLISGAGDGALIDLFRLKILGFTYDSFINKLGTIPKTQILITKLIQIKEDWKKAHSIAKDPIPADWLYRRLSRISNELKILDKYFLERIRNNIQVTLCCEKPVREIFNLSKISMINSVVLFILYNLNNNDKFFTYVKGRTVFEDKEFFTEITDKNNKIQKIVISDEVILRHGTDRINAFNNTPITTKQLNDLKTSQDNSKLQEVKLWDNLNLFSIFDSQERQSFCTNETISVCSNLVSILSKSLENQSTKSCKFRITLHRAYNSDSSFFYQQLTPYFGNWKVLHGKPGKIFPIMKGITGLSMLTGEPFLFNEKITKNTTLQKKLMIENSQSSKDSKSFLSIPVITKFASGEKASNLVLYIDSNTADFFMDDNRMTSIVSCLEGWIQNLESSLNREISMGEVDYEPLLINDSLKNKDNEALIKEVKSSECYENITKRYPGLTAKSTPLKLKRFYSFDIYHNPTPEVGYRYF